jgi:hypothetical protein
MKNIDSNMTQDEVVVKWFENHNVSLFEKDQNGEHYGIRPNLPTAKSRSGGDDLVSQLHAIYTECDPKDIPAQQAVELQLDAYHKGIIKPSALVHTGNKSVHFYLILEEPLFLGKDFTEKVNKFCTDPIEAIKVLQALLGIYATKLTGYKYDPACKKISGYLRWGTQPHPKTGQAPKLVHIGGTYKLEQIVEILVDTVLGISIKTFQNLDWKHVMNAVDVDNHLPGNRHNFVIGKGWLIAVREAAEKAGSSVEAELADTQWAIEPDTDAYKVNKQVKECLERPVKEKDADIQKDNVVEFKRPEIQKIDQESLNADMENMKAEERELEEMYAKCFSDKPLSYWLGESAKLYEGMIGDNIKNANPALALAHMIHILAMCPGKTKGIYPLENDGEGVDVSPNIYLYIVGGFSSGKSVIIKTLDKRIGVVLSEKENRLIADAKRTKKQKNELKELQKSGNLDISDRTINEKLESDDFYDQIKPTIKHNDVNPPMLSQAMQAMRHHHKVWENKDYSQFICTSEGRGLIDTKWNLTKEKGESALNLFCDLFDGKLNGRRRSTGGEVSVTIHNAPLSKIIAVQPDLIADLLNNKTALVSGYLSRILTIEIKNVTNKERIKKLEFPNDKEIAPLPSKKRDDDFEYEMKGVLDMALDGLYNDLIKNDTIAWRNEAIYMFSKLPELEETLDNPENEMLSRNWTSILPRLITAFAINDDLGYKLYNRNPIAKPIVVEQTHVERGYELMKLCLASMEYRKRLGMVAKEGQKALQDVEKPTRQREDKWFNLFSDPVALKEWVQDLKSNGATRKQITNKVAGKIKKRLSDQGLSVAELVKSVY